MKRLLLLLLAAASAQALPRFDEVRGQWRASDPRVLDREGRLLQEARRDFRGRRLEWVPLAEISQPTREAVLQAEDKRFYRHGGVDWKAAFAGAARALVGRPSRGASTITMQVAALLDPSLRPRRARRGLWQKWQQMQGARDLETFWSKDQILEAYLNLVTFRGELKGISAASRALFDKDPHGLTAPEGAMLAALIRSPNAPAATVARRACALSPEACDDSKALTLEVGHVRPRVSLAPHLARLVKSPDAEVRTTLDLDVQAFALDTLNESLRSLKEEHVLDGAVVVLDNRTGETLAYVGNGGLSQVDGVRAKRQAGSSLKPFLYALAFEKRRLTPASLLQDTPLDVPYARGVYRPANYDNLFRGPVPARRALAESLNIPAVRALMLVGEEAFSEKLALLGFELGDSKKYGPSLALGTADISLWDLTNAYRALANGGRWSRAKYLLSDNGEESRAVFEAGPVHLVSDILSDRKSRAATFGWESPLTTRFWSAVKTGTSKDMRDNWCVGFSSEYTVGVWVGNFDGSSMWNVSGATGAAPVWKQILSWLHRNQPSHAPAPPEGVVAKDGEKFLAGTEPAGLGKASVRGPARIGYPAAGSLFAWDPDIPPEQQRIVFEKDGEGGDLRWTLDGKRIGSAKHLPWRLQPGRHELRLVSSKGVEVDRVPFEVRGVDLDDTPGMDSNEIR